MSFTNTLTRYDAELVDLLARRPELRDVWTWVAAA